MKRATYMVFHLTRSNGGTFDNDARACYDRIVPPLALLRSHQLGMPQGPCRLLASLQSTMRYHVRVNNAMSTEYYQPTEDYRQYGSGQGFRNSPSLWTIISTLLLDAMPSKATGLRFVSQDQTIESTRQMDAYVDDTTVWTNNSVHSTRTPAEVAQTLSQAAQWWERLLAASGGALELSKCLFYLFHWKLSRTGLASMSSPHELQISIELTDSTNNQSCTIDHRDVRSVHKTQGVLLCPQDTDSEEFRRLTEKSRNLSRAIQSAKLTRAEARTAYNSIYLPSIGYSLGCTALTTQELSAIEAPFVHEIPATTLSYTGRWYLPQPTWAE